MVHGIAAASGHNNNSVAELLLFLLLRVGVFVLCTAEVFLQQRQRIQSVGLGLQLSQLRVLG